MAAKSNKVQALIDGRSIKFENAVIRPRRLSVEYEPPVKPVRS